MSIFLSFFWASLLSGVDSSPLGTILLPMCNHYRLRASPRAVASVFSAAVREFGNAGGDVYPGYPGIVVAEGAVQQMTWGFPLTLKGKSGQPLKPKPVNNARSDKLHSPFWKASFQSRRCLIPVECFAEAEGEKGKKTRTWFSVPDEPVFAVAGVWRDSREWGRVYSMVMTDAGPGMQGIHDRMPLILKPSSWNDWTDGRMAVPLTPYMNRLVILQTEEKWYQ